MRAHALPTDGGDRALGPDAPAGKWRIALTPPQPCARGARLYRFAFTPSWRLGMQTSALRNGACARGAHDQVVRSSGRIGGRAAAGAGRAGDRLPRSTGASGAHDHRRHAPRGRGARAVRPAGRASCSDACAAAAARRSPPSPIPSRFGARDRRVARWPRPPARSSSPRGDAIPDLSGAVGAARRPLSDEARAAVSRAGACVGSDAGRTIVMPCIDRHAGAVPNCRQVISGAQLRAGSARPEAI